MSSTVGTAGLANLGGFALNQSNKSSILQPREEDIALKFKEGRGYQFTKEVDAMQKKLDKIAKGQGENNEIEGGGTSKMFSMMN